MNTYQIYQLIYPSPNPLPKIWGGGYIELVKFWAAAPPKTSQKTFSPFSLREKGVRGMRGF
ncbi:MAG: hypothetical protein FOGNACKC_05981 [Anaerolineae bacterium]|nr:hypothetical protein [Anaerolineae bacterium]